MQTQEGTIKLVADVAVFSKGKTLLAKYANAENYNGQTGWFIPDDLIAFGEALEDAAKRILKEQLGIENTEVQFCFHESFIGMDKSWHLVFHFKAEVENDSVKQSSDIETQWFAINSLPDKKDVSHHGWALYMLETILG
jgi:ADP-ribose pyrophosphatase YjhB (NUDIX family)